MRVFVPAVAIDVNGRRQNFNIEAVVGPIWSEPDQPDKIFFTVDMRECEVGMKLPKGFKPVLPQ